MLLAAGGLGVWPAASASEAPEPGTAAHRHPAPVVLAPGYADLTFEAPVPGTYELPPLGRAPNGRVLDSQGHAVELHDLMGDKLVVLSFIYTTCSDVNGCPLATHVLSKVARRLGASRDLAGRVRLISLSFDPDHDTPAVMRTYGEPWAGSGGADWRFLTTAGETELGPILEGYGQWVLRDRDEEGKVLGTFSHVLRVFLIDQNLRIRNIYSVSFLHADTIGADLRTLLLEEPLAEEKGSSG